MDLDITPCSFAPVFAYNPDRPTMIPQSPVGPQGFPNLPEDWINEFETFSSSDAKGQLFGQLFRPKRWKGPNAHRVLLVFHGQGEHGGRYVHLPHYIKDYFGAVYCLDHQGHGHSRGRRGHIPHFDDYANDGELVIHRLYEYLLERFGKVELFVLGHSMGGLILLRTLLRFRDLPIEAAVCSAPMIDLSIEVPKIKEMASHVMLKVAPGLSIPGSDLSQIISRDPFVCEHNAADPLTHSMVSAAFYHSYLEVKEDLKNRAHEISYPVLTQIAGGDLIIDPDSQLELAKTMNQPGQTYKLYKNLYHEIYNEPEKEIVIKDMLEWITALKEERH
ncbi:MAG: alpha/beta hydrolase [Pseudobacteriovorax sp.]|nr:alpha/beta hydrolase [Pseudobacteriovorax sp.]